MGNRKDVTKAEREMMLISSYIRRFAIFSARFPWWFGMTNAAMTYLFFTFYFPSLALSEFNDPVMLRILDDLLHRNAIMNVMNGGLMTLFMLMTAFSLIKEFQRQGALGGTDDTDELFSMSREEFGARVVTRLTNDGFDVRKPKNSKSYADLVATRDAERVLIRFSDYRAYEIQQIEVERLVKAGKDDKATGVLYITVGRFSKKAQKYAAEKPVQLIDKAAAHAFFQIADQAQGDTQSAATAADVPTEGEDPPKRQPVSSARAPSSRPSGPIKAKSQVVIPRPEGQFNPGFVLPQQAVTPIIDEEGTKK